METHRIAFRYDIAHRIIRNTPIKRVFRDLNEFRAYANSLSTFLPTEPDTDANNCANCKFAKDDHCIVNHFFFFPKPGDIRTYFSEIKFSQRIQCKRDEDIDYIRKLFFHRLIADNIQPKIPDTQLIF